MADEVKFDPELRKRYSRVRPTVKSAVNLALQIGAKPKDIRNLRKVGYFAAETKQRELEQAEQEGRTDPITGLRNERGFNESLRAEVERAIRNKQILGLITLDLDNFKPVNDRYGHDKGDEVLKAIATILNDHAEGKESATRTIDIAVRKGGDEFFVITPDIKGGLELASGRIRVAIERKLKELVKGIEDIPVSASIGATTFLPEKEKYEQGEIEEIIKRLKIEADTALYVSKHSGKNKLTLYQQGMIIPQESK